MTASDLLDVCKTRGVELTATGDTLQYRAPAGVIDAPLKAELVARKLELIAVLVATCPNCRRSLDPKRRCWRCEYRACEVCGRPSGSVFIATCICCDLGGAG